MAQPGHLPMAAIEKVRTTAQRGSRWLKRRFNGRRGSETSTDTRTLAIVSMPSASRKRSNPEFQGPPTNFRRQDLTLGRDDAG